MPLIYPMAITAIKRGLFPSTTFVRSALAIDMGQLAPKQTSMSASKILMNRLTPFSLHIWRYVIISRAAPFNTGPYDLQRKKTGETDSPKGLGEITGNRNESFQEFIHGGKIERIDGIVFRMIGRISIKRSRPVDDTEMLRISSYQLTEIAPRSCPRFKKA